MLVFTIYTTVPGFNVVSVSPVLFSTVSNGGASSSLCASRLIEDPAAYMFLYPKHAHVSLAGPFCQAPLRSSVEDMSLLLILNRYRLLSHPPSPMKWLLELLKLHSPSLWAGFLLWMENKPQTITPQSSSDVSLLRLHSSRQSASSV